MQIAKTLSSPPAGKKRKKRGFSCLRHKGFFLYSHLVWIRPKERLFSERERGEKRHLSPLNLLSFLDSKMETFLFSRKEVKTMKKFLALLPPSVVSTPFFRFDCLPVTSLVLSSPMQGRRNAENKRGLRSLAVKLPGGAAGGPLEEGRGSIDKSRREGRCSCRRRRRRRRCHRHPRGGKQDVATKFGQANSFLARRRCDIVQSRAVKNSLIPRISTHGLRRWEIFLRLALDLESFFWRILHCRDDLSKVRM